jgi:hypothetical protein
LLQVLLLRDPTRKITGQSHNFSPPLALTSSPQKLSPPLLKKPAPVLTPTPPSKTLQSTIGAIGVSRGQCFILVCINKEAPGRWAHSHPPEHSHTHLPWRPPKSGLIHKHTVKTYRGRRPGTSEYRTYYRYRWCWKKPLFNSDNMDRGKEHRSVQRYMFCTAPCSVFWTTGTGDNKQSHRSGRQYR